MSLYSDLPKDSSKKAPKPAPSSAPAAAPAWSTSSLFASTTFLKPRKLASAPASSSSSSSSSKGSDASSSSSKRSVADLLDDAELAKVLVVRSAPPPSDKPLPPGVLSKRKREETNGDASPSRKKKRVTFAKDTKTEDAKGPNKYHILDASYSHTQENRSPLHAMQNGDGGGGSFPQSTGSGVFHEFNPRKMEKIVEEYDPAKPNDYADYLNERRMKAQLKEKEEKIAAMRKQMEEQAEAMKKEHKKKLNMSGEEAYIRRLRMSDPAAADKYEAELKAKVAAENSGSSEGSGADESSANKDDSSSSKPGEAGEGGEEAAQPQPPAPSSAPKTFAERMLAKMGWKAGEGLGKNRQGIASPLVHSGAFNKIVEADKRTSSVMCILNMVGRGEVDQGLAHEVIEETSKYGDVENCIVYQSQDPNCIEEEAVVIYVKFVYDKDCEAAIFALNGRFFGGRTVKAMFFDEGLYEARAFA